MPNSDQGFKYQPLRHVNSWCIMVFEPSDTVTLIYQSDRNCLHIGWLLLCIGPCPIHRMVHGHYKTVKGDLSNAIFLNKMTFKVHNSYNRFHYESFNTPNTITPQPFPCPMPLLKTLTPSQCSNKAATKTGKYHIYLPESTLRKTPVKTLHTLQS